MVVETSQKIWVPRNLEGKEFWAPRDLDEALRSCQEQGFEAVFMPSIVDARIEAPKDALIWQTWWSAPSIRATGKNKQGTPVVVYAHIPNYFSNPDNITEAIKKGLVGSAGVMPESEFQMLLDLEDNKDVFVVDYNTLKNAPSGVIPLSKALEHPQTIPLLGGKERAEAYLERHKEVYGERIGIWHSADLSEKPLGRLLFLGANYVNGLNGDYDLDGSGRFVGVRAEGAAPKMPSLEQVLTFLEPFVAPSNRGVVTSGLTQLYS